MSLPAKFICLGSAGSFGGLSYVLAQVGDSGLPAPNWTNLGVAGILAMILGFFIRYVAQNVVPKALESNQAAFEAIARAHEKTVAGLIESNKEAITELISERKIDRAIAREDLVHDRTVRERMQAEAMRELRERNDYVDRRLNDLNEKMDYTNRVLLLLRERGCKNVNPSGTGGPFNAEDSGILGPQILTRPQPKRGQGPPADPKKKDEEKK